MQLDTILSKRNIAYIRQYKNVETLEELEEFVKSCPDSTVEELKTKLSKEAIYIICKMRYPDPDRLIHRNLRKYLSENCITPILGKDYYNMGMDVYTCDQFVTEDIKYKYECTKSNRNALGVLFGISFILNIVFIISKFIS